MRTKGGGGRAKNSVNDRIISSDGVKANKTRTKTKQKKTRRGRNNKTKETREKQ